jgi:hypothetical protein
MTIARSQMNRQLYQIGGGIMQLNNGQEEPIFPRLETLSQNLGQAEQTLGEPTNQFNASSITTAITGRPPMNRGGVASLVDREKYGLGSKIKKFVRNIIPNEVAQVASAAGPVVAFFNPALGAAMTGLGNFDRTGRIGSSLGKAALTYGAATVARGIGGAGFPTTGQEFLTSLNPFANYNPQSGFMGLESLFTSPIGTQSGLNLGQYFQNPAMEFTTGEQIGKPTGIFDQLKTVFSPSSNVGLETRAKTAMDLTGQALKAMYTIPDGKGGTTVDKRMVLSTLAFVPSYLDAKKKADEAGIPPNEFTPEIHAQLQQEIGFFGKRYADLTPRSSFMAEGGLMDDTGGILSIKLTPAQAKAKGGTMGSEIPVRQNQGGITELDLRAKGGYIPVGIKEKADDVPAMLSKNEFVFTADAVRGAGDGNINKGAQKMYKLMKSLEKKVKKIKKVA